MAKEALYGKLPAEDETLHEKLQAEDDEKIVHAQGGWRYDG